MSGRARFRRARPGRTPMPAPCEWSRCAPGAKMSERGVEERRDVRTDFLRLFGKRTRFVDAVAVMTDTDDSGGSAVAYYGYVRFTSE